MNLTLKTTINDLIAALRVFTLSAADRHTRKLDDRRGDRSAPRGAGDDR